MSAGVATPKTGKNAPIAISYGFNFWKFILYIIKNMLALALGSIASLCVPLVIYALNLQSLAEFNFMSAIQSVIYDWLYDDVFVAILTLGVTIIITYLVSFRRESEAYLGAFTKKVDLLAVVCLLLCIIMIVFEIIYAWHSDGTNVGELPAYTILEIVSLVLCCFFQSFSHPEYYMTIPQYI